MKDRTGQLKRGDLPALLLAAATPQPQTASTLCAQVCTTPGQTPSVRRLQRSLASLRALGYLTPELARTPKGDAELARLRAPLTRGRRGPGRTSPTGATRRIRQLLRAFSRLHTAHLAAALGVSRHRVGIYLGELVKRGQVERVRGTHFREYRLTDAGWAA